MYPKAFVDYLVYFHSFRDYFECHEVLEEHWKKEGKEDILWVGFIQLAVSMYHYRRGNDRGAYKQINSAINILKQQKNKLVSLGLDEEKLLKALIRTKNDLTEKTPYSPIHLPIKDDALLTACIKSSKEKAVPWGVEPIMISNELIDKHRLRDRTSIIEERQKKLENKNTLK